MNQEIVDVFEIPEELAKKLSDLLTKETIRYHMLNEVANDPVKFESIEKMLIGIVQNINSIKNMITMQYVPEKYQSEKYRWNFDGYEVSKNKVQIYEV